MKITSYLYLFFIVALYMLNYFVFNINVFTFTGIVLGTLVVFIIAVNIYIKLRDKKKGLHSDDFIFSPEIAQSIKKVDMGIQYETSIISTFFLIIGLLLFVIYTIFFTPYPLVTKIFISFNSFFAMILMASLLITNYQQFISYRESTKMFSQYTDKIGSEILSVDSMLDIVRDSKPFTPETNNTIDQLLFEKYKPDKVEPDKNNKNNVRRDN